MSSISTSVRSYISPSTRTRTKPWRRALSKTRSPSVLRSLHERPRPGRRVPSGSVQDLVDHLLHACALDRMAVRAVQDADPGERRAEDGRRSRSRSRPSSAGSGTRPSGRSRSPAGPSIWSTSASPSGRGSRRRTPTGSRRSGAGPRRRSCRTRGCSCRCRRGRSSRRAGRANATVTSLRLCSRAPRTAGPGACSGECRDDDQNRRPFREVQRNDRSRRVGRTGPTAWSRRQRLPKSSTRTSPGHPVVGVCAGPGGRSVPRRRISVAAFVSRPPDPTTTATATTSGDERIAGRSAVDSARTTVTATTRLRPRSSRQRRWRPTPTSVQTADRLNRESRAVDHPDERVKVQSSSDGRASRRPRS